MRVAHLLVLVVAVSVLSASVPATPAPSQAPAVAVHVDNAPLDRGDDYHTSTDPWVRVTVDAESPISLVEVRVDGETRHAFEPGSESFERSVRLDLTTGSHQVRVVAKADDVTTHAATITKDDEAPVVNYSAPFPAGATPQEPALPPAEKLTVTRANVSVDGTLTDLSAVDAVRIDHRYDYRHAGETEANREGRRQHLIPSPGASFNQSLYLAPGPNDVTVRAEDALGNRRIHRFTITVEDDTAPALNVTDVDWVSPTRLRIEGRATDSVQVDAVWVATENGSAGDVDTTAPDRHPLVFPRSTAPDRDRRTVTLDAAAYHPPNTDYVVVGANDTAGNARTQNLSLRRFLAPTIRVDNRTTRYVDDRTVAVAGRITDGEVGTVSVEAVDPATGDVVDIRPVEPGPNDTFATRLDGAANATQVRIRARDASGVERVRNVTVTAPVEDTTPSGRDATARATATPDADGPSGANRSSEAASAEADDARSTIRVPFVGVVFPVPGVPAPLTAAVSLPLPFVGPVSVPVVPVGVGGLLVGVVAWRRR